MASFTTYDACSCIIASAKSVTVPVNSLSLILITRAWVLWSWRIMRLYQSDDEIVNTGTIKIKRKTKPILKFDYTYWSSPVANQSLFNTSPETLSNKFFSFNPNTNSWLTEVSSKTMVTAKDILFEDPKFLCNKSNL
jgi:hypothetical protein